MKNYELTYRERRNTGAEEYTCTIMANNMKEVRNNFNEFDNANREYTITKIERV